MAPSTQMGEQEMVRLRDQAASPQAAPMWKDFEAGPVQKGPADPRVRDALEDDEVREALKSLHGIRYRCPKAK